MSLGTLSAQQLRSLVEDKWQRDAEALVLGLHVAQPWQAPEVVEIDQRQARVVRADTVFEVREVLRDAERNQDRVILMTRLRQAELGHDVVARLARARLFAIDHWASLCSLFKAKELDRSICQAALAEALLECAPADGYPPVPAGLLDAGTVWRAVCRHVFEMGDLEPDLVSLLLWATHSSGAARYRNASEELRESLRKRLVANLGGAAESILRFVDCAAEGDALALAVTCQVVFGEGSEGVLDAAAARMEQYHDNLPIPHPVGQLLGQIANEAMADLDRAEDPRRAQQHLQRADELLTQFRCENHAWRNRLTWLGYEQRLARLGRQISVTLGDRNAETIRQCERLHQELATHRRAKLGQRPDQLLRAEMALRLLRWLDSTFPVATTLGELADDYRRELAFVDWARESICRGEDVAELTAAYQQLDQAILTRREQFNRTFAKGLAEWTATGTSATDVLGVEQVLSQVVARIAQGKNPVLLVVLDGMSWPVCHELLQDIRNEHWIEGTLEEESDGPPVVLAAIPSVTRRSRASLLSGELTVGDSGVEKRNFEANTDLLGVSERKFPPVLFHKREVTEGSRGVVGEDLSQAILSAEQRVVGVVINAIDDRLATAQQVRELWTINRISPLGAILKLARDAGRVVVLASDHGHVWHRPEAQLCSGDAESRWRSNKGDLLDGELVLTGTRVSDELGGRSVIVPWSETIYYSKAQNGYHGGATPQEMVCPLMILFDKASHSKGVFECALPNPEWWTAAPEGTLAPKPVAPRKRRGVLFSDDVVDQARGKPPTTPAALPASEGRATGPAAGAGQANTGEARREGAAVPAWIDRLLKSTVYAQQKALAGRNPPPDEQVAKFLAILDARGGKLTTAALARALAFPELRLPGLLSKLQRLLNVDGYAVLNRDDASETVELNRELLLKQFDLGEE
ncbi:MAG TPA: BREX-2 system phosphatase PglZ [Planctomycetaceae bacterium]|nr:BREX-2 system phosphatase PglZ [Planctomycetaceae bacterium]